MRALTTGLTILGVAGIVFAAGFAGSGGVQAQESRDELARAAGRAEEHDMIVVELFTSQGCSSCPPADTLLSELHSEAQRNNTDVLFVGWHVDYWDYLGWEDPYGDRSYSQRQRQYARVFQTSTIYTPQMIVDGHYVVSNAGNRRAAVGAIARAAKERGDYRVSITGIRRDGDELLVSFRVDEERSGRGRAAIGFPGRAQIGALLLEDGLYDLPSRGENIGRQLRNDAVVRGVEWDSLRGEGESTIRIRIDDDVTEHRARVALIVQDRSTRRILTATSREL